MKCDVCGDNCGELHKIGRANICAGCYGMAQKNQSKAAPVQEPPRVEVPQKDFTMTDAEKIKIWRHNLIRLATERSELNRRIKLIEGLIDETEKKLAAEKKA
jgi:hypothetical protein